MSRPRVLVLLLLPALAAAALGQKSTQKPAPSGPASATVVAKDAPAPTPDFSQEPYVFEQYANRWRFEDDGTGVRQISARVRVNSEAGVQQLGQLLFGYNSDTERLEVEYVRVRKGDGTVVNAGQEAAQDLPAALVREAPVYTDFRERHITVPGLRPGELLEYSVLTRFVTPLMPGHFWLSHDFEKRTIILQEELVADVPKGRALRLKTQPGHDPKVREENGRRVYTWSSFNLEVERPDQEKKKDKKDKKKKKRDPDQPSDVQLTTLSSWDEVGKWYAALLRERVKPSDAIRTKAQELVRDKKTDLEKIQALYDFVATNFRYISLSFGVGRFQPHAAAEVFGNQYGDCKDKHTLLAAMLQAAGFRPQAVMIHSQRKLDPEVVSLSQFDHMITAVPLGDELLWMDTTTEVAPFRMLIASLRKKRALVIASDGGARILETPAAPPFPGLHTVEVEGEISTIGTLQAQVRHHVRGDTEVLMRLLFRRTPRANWNMLAQYLSTMTGLRGEVTEVKPSEPAATREPFGLEYKVTASNYLDWSNRKTQLDPYLPLASLPEVSDDDLEGNDPLKLGGDMEVSARMKLKLPERYTARAPVPITLKRDYAEYSSQYSATGSTVTAERRLRVSVPELPVARGRDYLAFKRAVRADEEQKMALEAAVAGAPGALDEVKVEELYEAGLSAWRANNLELAADLLKRVVEREPTHKEAWNELGRVYLGLSRVDDAVAAFRKQIEANPYDEFGYNNLGRALWRQEKHEEAIAAFHKQIEINPLDPWAHGNLGALLNERRRYAEAASALEKAVGIRPDNPQYQISLGEAYLNLEQPDKALAAFDKAVELAPTPPVWNNVAYQLSLKGVHLDRAQQYAESAVAAVSAQLRNVSLERVRLEDMGLVASVGANWDTLGWVYFGRGDLERAEQYVEAAWLLSQHAEIGDHLAQIYEKRERAREALDMYVQALAALRPVPETRERALKLMAAQAPPPASAAAAVQPARKKVAAKPPSPAEELDKLVSAAKPALEKARQVSLGKLAAGDSEADFLVLLADSGVEAVKFVRGDEKLKPHEATLKAARFRTAFPDKSPTKLLRRGTLRCRQGDCVFTLVLPDEVHSVN